MSRRPTEKHLELEAARLRGLKLPELRMAWAKHYSLAAPKTLRREMLVQSILYQIRVKAFGGLKPETRRYLDQVADAATTKGAVPPQPPLKVRTGTKLIRVWQGQTHTVTAVDDAFEWQGKRYRSLSQIARIMTGTRWNGLVFFGIKSKPKMGTASRQRGGRHASRSPDA